MRSGSIMILEADASLRHSRSRVLSREGYSVTGVTSTEEAVEVSRRQPFDLLIVRADEPQQLRALFAQLPSELSVLLIASISTISQVAEYAGTGIHSFLLEPFTSNSLRNVTAETIDSTRLVKRSIRSNVLTSLVRANWLLTSETETDRFFQRIVEISAADTKAEYVLLSLKDETSGAPVTRAEVGDHNPDLQPICKQVIATGEPLLIDQATQDLEFRRLLTDTGATAIMCVPLSIKGAVVGAIGHAKMTEETKFTASDLNFATLIAWWSSMALENTQLFGRVQRQYLHMERLLEEIRVAQENERRRVAVEIHDGVAQWMVGASYGIKAIGNLISEQRLTDIEFELTKIRDTVQTSIKELRRAIANLRPLPLEELGLIAAIRQAAESLKGEGIKCEIEISENLPQLTPAQESTTYWIVQEMLSNVRKHSAATEATVRVINSDRMLSVEVSDNGQGFTPERVINSESPLVHLGILGMQDRAKLLGGSLKINSKPGKGTSICFTFPVDTPEMSEVATSS